MIQAAFSKRTACSAAHATACWPPIVTKVSGSAWTPDENTSFWKKCGAMAPLPGESGTRPAGQQCPGAASSFHRTAISFDELPKLLGEGQHADQAMPNL